MWMLSSARAELHLFQGGPSSVPGGYCILSHTWGDHEQTLQDIQANAVACKANKTNPRDSVSAKIRECCIKAEEYGHEWVWIDTCCIDKTSSTELSEAINSMFSWYVLAEVCFVLFEDVPVDDDFYAEDSAFRRARWHTRGWTLQELLAPAFMIFFADNWEEIGTKQELAPLLEQVSHIPMRFLTHEDSFLDNASVSERIYWASNRNTTRVEDEAYSLLGIFDIKMTTLYGEGRQAFRRLQHEIVKRSPSETSVLSWGPLYDAEGFDAYQPVLPTTMVSMYHGLVHQDRFLFASSPQEFSNRDLVCGHISYEDLGRPSQDHGNFPPSLNGPFGEAEIPWIESTAQGIKCRFPVAEVEDIIVAVIARTLDNGNYLGLLLHPHSDVPLQRPDTQQLFATWAFSADGEGVGSRAARLAYLGCDIFNLTFRDVNLTPRVQWRDVFIFPEPRFRQSTMSDHTTLRLAKAFVPFKFSNEADAFVPFRFPRTLLQSLATDKLFVVDAGRLSHMPESCSWHAYITLSTKSGSEEIGILLGLCAMIQSDDDDGTEPPRATHWAWAGPSLQLADGSDFVDYVHDCATDHVRAGDEPREFGDEARAIRLSFRQSRYDAEGTLAMYVDLAGAVYEARLNAARVKLPQVPANVVPLSRPRAAIRAAPTPEDEEGLDDSGSA